MPTQITLQEYQEVINNGIKTRIRDGKPKKVLTIALARSLILIREVQKTG